MFKALFGEITDGRLARLPYLGYLLLISIIIFGAMFGVVALISSAENIMDGNIQHIQTVLIQKFGMALVILMMAFFLAMSFASMNIAAKRIRDMGLWGWTSILVLAVVGGIVATLFPGETVVLNGSGQMIPSPVSSAFQAVVFLCLLLIPTNSFSKKT